MIDEEPYEFDYFIFDVFEKSVIALYDLDQLTPKVLDTLAGLWHGYEVRVEASQLRAKDGGTIDEIVTGTILGTVEDTWGEFAKICKERWGWK